MAIEPNFNYYGIETTVWPSAGENIAKMVKGNTFNYYYYTDEIPETWGKPFDDSVALWKLAGNASFACPGYVYLKPGTTLQAEFKVNENEKVIPFVMQATPTSYNYSTYPHFRIADNYTNNEKILMGRLCYDINPQKFCLNVQTWLWDRTADTNNSAALDQIGGQYKSLANTATTINSNNNYKVVCIRNFMYFGGSESPRTTAGKHITENLLRPGEQQEPCVPLAEPYTYRPLPDDANMRKRMKYMFSSEEHPDWTTDKVFNPFSQSGGGAWYSTLGAPTSNDNQYNIGILRSWTRNQVQQGANSIPDTGGKISGQWLNCNFGNKDFDDVAYHWRSYVWDAEHKVEVTNGLPLASITGSSYIRVVTELVIDDRKGRTLGEATANAVKHEVAYLGFYFAGESSYAANAVLGDQGTGVGIYLPKRVEGIPNGEYYTGQELVNSDEAKQTSTGEWSKDSEGVYSEDLETRFNQFELKDSTRLFGMTASEWSTLVHWLNTGVQTYLDTDDKFRDNFKNINPADYVLSMRYYPFDLPVAEGNDVYVGPVPVLTSTSPDVHFNAGVIPRRVGPKATQDYGGQSLWDFGTVSIPLDKDFRAAQTKLLLYIPWCGYTDLDPMMFVDISHDTLSRLNVKISIDYATGSCMGIVSRVTAGGNTTVIQTVNGSCGIDVPLFSINQGEYAKTIKDLEVALQQAEISRFTAGLGLAGATIGAAGAAMSGNVMGALAGAGSMLGTAAGLESNSLKIEALNYQLDHYAPSVSQISGASPFNNVLFEAVPKLLIFKPIMLSDYNEDIYAKTVGHACVKQGTLGSFSGLTVCSNFQLGGLGCTAEEQALLSSLLTSGIII